MKTVFQSSLLLIVLYAFGACKQPIPSTTTTFQLSEARQIVFLDSLEATTAITTDESEHFFEHITPLDMSIQMQQSYPAGTERATILADYRQFLKEDVTDFSQEDVEFIQDIFQEAVQKTNQLSSSIFPDEICLIKTNGRHYGPSVYYTRDRCIVIPANVLAAPEESAFLETMLHEVFHIFSRYHPEQREALYQLIGFEDIGAITDLQLPPALAQRYLLNPDGVDFAEAIQLQLRPDSSVQAVPIVISNETELVPSKSTFFPYLEFQLFPIQPLASGDYAVLAKADGTSPLELNTLADFFRQIRDNTNYIIHPDEILADNFVLLVMDDNTAQLSERGQQLLRAIENILRN